MFKYTADFPFVILKINTLVPLAFPLNQKLLFYSLSHFNLFFYFYFFLKHTSHSCISASKVSLHNTSPKMLSLPPPPPKQTKPSPPNHVISSKQDMNPPPNQTKPSPPNNQMILSGQAMNPPQKQNRPSPNQNIVSNQDMLAPNHRAGKSKFKLLHPPRRTNPVIWCGAFLCVIFSLLLILAGIAILIIYLVIKPRHPLFDTTGASLNSIYLDSAEYLNGDFTFLANFSNPNQKIDVRFEYLDIGLYFFDSHISTQVLKPFSQRRGEARLESIHMISSEVYLPLNLAMELQKQVQNNTVKYNIRGTFRVRVSIGLAHYSYWLYGRCKVEMTSPPSGVLTARSCRTKR